MYINIYKFHRIPDRQSRFIAQVHDLLGQPSYIELSYVYPKCYQKQYIFDPEKLIYNAKFRVFQYFLKNSKFN